MLIHASNKATWIPMQIPAQEGEISSQLWQFLGLVTIADEKGRALTR